jgi:hypothetical protein
LVTPIAKKLGTCIMPIAVDGGQGHRGKLAGMG